MQKNSVVRLEHSQVCQAPGTIMTLNETVVFKLLVFKVFRLGWVGLFIYLYKVTLSNLICGPEYAYS